MSFPTQLVPYMYQPMERAAAKASGQKQYFTGRPCKYGHIANRCTSSGSCVICANISEKKSRNKALINDPNLYKKRYAINPERAKKAALKYRLENPEKAKATYRIAKLKRRAKATAAERERQIAKIGATPKWLSKEQKKQIANIYEMARKTSFLAGFKCHVDHIVPIKGKLVCGLHVPWNLRVVSQSYNSKKFNKLDDGILFTPSSINSVLIHSSALPWNWRK